MPTESGSSPGLQRLDPGEHLGPVVPLVPAERNVGDRAGACVVADPAERDAEHGGDLPRVEEPVVH
jgi:hypothetical protein